MCGKVKIDAGKEETHFSIPENCAILYIPNSKTYHNTLTERIDANGKKVPPAPDGPSGRGGGLRPSAVAALHRF